MIHQYYKDNELSLFKFKIINRFQNSTAGFDMISLTNICSLKLLTTVLSVAKKIKGHLIVGNTRLHVLNFIRNVFTKS